MRALRIVLALLCVFGVTVARADTWQFVARENDQFTLTAPATLRYGKDPTWLTFQRNAGSYECSNSALTDPLPGVIKECQIRVTVSVPVIADISCFPSDLFSVRFHTSVAAIEHNHVVTWQCGGVRQVLLYSDAERDSLMAAAWRGEIKSAASLNAWRKTQPAWNATVEEAAFANTIRALYDLKYVVAASSSGTRPYYKSNADKTGISSKLGNVAVGKDCDGSQRLGDTTYYFVPSVNGYAVCAVLQTN